jgi:hypothetical protein
VVELVRLVYPHHSGRGGVDRFTLWVRHVHGVAAYTYVRVGITCPAGRCQAVIVLQAAGQPAAASASGLYRIRCSYRAVQLY